MALYETLRSSAIALGFAAFGAAEASGLGPEVKQRLSEYLAEGRNADMDYMERNVDKRLDVTLLVEGARTVMGFLAPYDHHDNPHIASFAHGEDYHKVIKDRIHMFVKENLDALSSAAGGGFAYRVFTDSAPVMEREWAVRCGLGFIGCNNFLISPTAGLRTLIGILICNVPFSGIDCRQLRQQKESMPADCGRCLECIKACPSGALVAPYRIDARKCISFLTIEARQKDLSSPGVHGHLFGCDCCMDACPWNKDVPGWPQFSSNADVLAENPDNIFSIFARNRK
jgi:epoxyqueuosine reductase